jgi:hypothetical protein
MAIISSLLLASCNFLAVSSENLRVSISPVFLFFKSRAASPVFGLTLFYLTLVTLPLAKPKDNINACDTFLQSSIVILEG